MSALEIHVAQRIDEMRFELGEIRAMLTAQIEADSDATELLGRLLRATSSRLDLLEESVAPTGGFTSAMEHRD
jgi:hypothetical protein